jgi:hypothetical protein
VILTSASNAKQLQMPIKILKKPYEASECVSAVRSALLKLETTQRGIA